MKDSPPVHKVVSDGRTRPGASRRRGFNLLLVSRSEAWAEAVRGAAEAAGGGVTACTAHEALAHLAGPFPRHSHVLVDQADADGLFDELARLALEGAASEKIDMLTLGLTADRRDHIGMILEASPRSVIEALMSGSPPRDTIAMDLAELRVALRGAMIENRYQPIVRLADRHPIGLEALARLNHPKLGTLLPDRFVPQIEDAGLAAELTDLVSARAFADMAEPWLAERGVRVSVNFPLDVLLHAAALDRLEQQRAACGIDPARVIVELTESRPVDDFPLLRRSLDHLRGLGYGVAIDDAGPAVPWLTELLDLPFTSLKLDKDLIAQLADSDTVRRFVDTTVTQAGHRGMTVVAEGVETMAIWDRMRALGVDEAQGFWVGRPLPLAAVPVWTDAWIGRITAGPG
jgi:EAL domain-containing protein (putative c-di-GMP-specific phosphodiesterase class I)